MPANPADLISQLRQQGLSNSQIVQALQQQGLRSNQIFDAMNQADLKPAGPVAGMGPPQMQQQPPSQQMQNMQQQMQAMPGQGRVGGEIQMPPPMMGSQSMPPPMDMQNNESNIDATSADTEKIEEIVEAIVEEKWTELIKNVNKIIEWKEKTESRLVKMETEFDNLKHGFDNLHQGVLGKIGDYEHGLQEIGTDIKALEKVFQKILPTLTENVNELSRITRNMGAQQSSAVKKK
ncbi:TPA: hypothetical protein HA246_00135 [Candidatus Woesearchaeota archaeon]|nr:hypothetical protein [Candidatus Woesearchaeota archaeon]